MSAADTNAFDALLAQVDRAAGFGHRQHLQLTWLAVRSHGTADAVPMVSDGLRRFAADAGAPEKYHVTMTRAWVLLVAHHAALDPRTDFDAFLAATPGLLDTSALLRFYRPEALASGRATWVEPDLAPLPL